MLNTCTAWVAGLSLLCLVVGGKGSIEPLEPGAAESAVSNAEPADAAIVLEDFLPPDSGPTPDPAEEVPTETTEPPDLPEVPPLVQPLTPPELPELTRVVTPPPPAVKPSKPLATPPSKPVAPKTSSAAGAAQPAGNGSGPPTLFSSGGTGRYPAPTYPAAALASRQQGSLKLLVTVEADGTPSVIELQSSSGYASLDRAAKDIISRKWRWPNGSMRRFIIPFNFVLPASRR